MSWGLKEEISPQQKWDAKKSDLYVVPSIRVTLTTEWNHAVLSLHVHGLLNFKYTLPNERRSIFSSQASEMNWSSAVRSVQVTPLTSGSNSIEERDGGFEVTLISRKCSSSLWDLARKYTTAQGGYLKHCLIS